MQQAGGSLKHNNTPVDARQVAKIRRITVLTVICVAVIFGLYVIIQKSVIPRAPKISVTSVSVSSFKIYSTFVTADWGFAFSIHNPNRVRVEYGTIEASVVYGEVVLGNTLLSPFSQREHNETSLTVRFSAISDYLNDGAAQGLTADRARGSIQVQVKLFISLSCKCGGWPRIRIQNFNVLCRDVTLGFSSTSTQWGDGSLSGAPRKCKAKTCW